MFSTVVLNNLTQLTNQISAIESMLSQNFQELIKRIQAASKRAVDAIRKSAYWNIAGAVLSGASSIGAGMSKGNMQKVLDQGSQFFNRGTTIGDKFFQAMQTKEQQQLQLDRDVIGQEFTKLKGQVAEQRDKLAQQYDNLARLEREAFNGR